MKRRNAQANQLDGLTTQGREDWHRLCAELRPLLGSEMAADEDRQAEAIRAWMGRVPDTLGAFLSAFYLSEVVAPMLPLVGAHAPAERADFMRRIGDMVVGSTKASMDEASRIAETHQSP